MSRELDRAVKRLAVIVEPPAVLHQRVAVERAVERSTGRLTAQALSDAHNPQRMHFTVGTDLPRCVDEAGTLIRARVRCATAPTTGDAVVTITKSSQYGSTDSFEVRVQVGENYSDPANTPISMDLLATDWLGAATTTANGAGGISLTLTIQGGQI